MFVCVCVCVDLCARPRYGHETLAGTPPLATLCVPLWKTCVTALFTKMFRHTPHRHFLKSGHELDSCSDSPPRFSHWQLCWTVLTNTISWNLMFMVDPQFSQCYLVWRCTKNVQLMSLFPLRMDIAVFLQFVPITVSFQFSKQLPILTTSLLSHYWKINMKQPPCPFTCVSQFNWLHILHYSNLSIH